MQKLQLTIPEPCHENWQNMTPTDQGRFCNACAKEVIDFSMMTDTEVLNYFTALTHDKVCGRALPSQLERTISKPKDPKKRLFWYWNYMVMFFMFFGKGKTAKAQGGIKPVTECSPVRGKSEVITVAGYTVRRTTQTITGKITDKDGIPISFASIKIKGTNGGVVADANGAYSLKLNSNAMLVISGASFKDAEVVVGNQSFINTVMEKSGIDIKEVVVTGHRHVRQYYDATFVVKDMETGLPISKAKVVIVESGNSNYDIEFTDNEGKYQAKHINVRESYNVKIIAEGYKSNEFSIEQTDFKNRKEGWEVLLKKQKPLLRKRVTQSSKNIKGDFQVHIVGQTRISTVNTDSLYIIDGLVSTKQIADNLNPDDISDTKQLNQSEAMAIYGSQASYGAIVITTRKAKEKKLDTVTVTGYGRTTGLLVHTITRSYTIREKVADTLKVVETKITGAIKIYPNPVQRGQEFSIALKLKEAVMYQMQITDVAGRIVLQKQINANAKDVTEKIMSDSRWTAGVYYICVFAAQNKLVSKSSFIVQ